MDATREGEEDPSALLADAFVAFLDRCAAEPLFSDEYLALAEPAAFAARPDPRQQFIASFDAQKANPALDFNSAAVDACLADLANLECASAVGAESCNQIFLGNRESGEGCATSTECADSDVNFCRFEPFEGCGTCRALPGEGDPCPDEQCAADQICSGNSSTCVVLPGEGETCEGDDCAAGLTCSDDTGTGTCEVTVVEEPPAPPEVGDPCGDAGCRTFTTALGCNIETDTCEELDVVQPGEACDPNLGEIRYCVNEFLAGFNACVDVDGDEEFTCTVVPGVGEACLEGRCSFDSGGCDEDTDECVAASVVGESCRDVTCADELDCDTESEDPDDWTCVEFVPTICSE